MKNFAEQVQEECDLLFLFNVRILRDSSHWIARSIYGVGDRAKTIIVRHPCRYWETAKDVAREIDRLITDATLKRIVEEEDEKWRSP